MLYRQAIEVGGTERICWVAPASLLLRRASKQEAVRAGLRCDSLAGNGRAQRVRTGNLLLE
jgi:hypothetical protein